MFRLHNTREHSRRLDMIYQRDEHHFQQVDPTDIFILQRDSEDEPEVIPDTPPPTPEEEDDDFPTDLPSHWGSFPDLDGPYSLPPTPPTIDGPFTIPPSPSVTDPGPPSLISENRELDFLDDEKENTTPSSDDYPELDLRPTRRPFREPLSNPSAYLNRRTELDNINEAIANWDSVDFIIEVSDWVF